MTAAKEGKFAISNELNIQKNKRTMIKIWIMFYALLKMHITIKYYRSCVLAKKKERNSGFFMSLPYRHQALRIDSQI